MLPSQVINAAIEHYGKQHQLVVAMEEMSELIKELSKDIRGKANRNHIVEEIVDVKIMIEQLEQIYEITKDELFVNRIRKLNRLVERMENE